MGLGSGIKDPGSGKNPSRIQGSKKHRIPDPHPQHCEKLVTGTTYRELVYDNFHV